MAEERPQAHICMRCHFKHFLHGVSYHPNSPCHVCAPHVCAPSLLSSSFCGLYVRPLPFPFLPFLQLTWDSSRRGDLFFCLCDDLCDPLLESAGMDLGEHLQEEPLDIHLEPLDKDVDLELRKASPLVVHLVAWLGSSQLGTGLVGGSLLVQVQKETQGCSQEGRQGSMGPLEGEDLIYIMSHIHVLLRAPLFNRPMART